MDKEKLAGELRLWIIYLCGIAIGIIFSLVIINFISAEENITNGTIIINNTYIYNQTYIYNYSEVINNTINNTFYLNQTNISCFNCSYNYTIWNITNLTCINCNYTNITTFVNDSGYTNEFIDTKFNTLQTNINDLQTRINNISILPTSKQWQNKDTYFVLGIIISIIISILAILLILNGGG